MTKVHFQEVAIRGVRKWKNAEGKWRQETKKFFQTINPFNLRNGVPKTAAQIREELIAEREAWYASFDGKPDGR